MKHMIITFVFAAAVLTACKKNESSTPAAGSATAPVAAGSAATGSAATGSATGSDTAMAGSGSGSAAVDVPTEVDFEDQAATDITDKNVEAKVKALETDLAP